MNRNLSLSLALLVLLFLQTFTLPAQIYDEVLTLPTLVEGGTPYTAMCEDPQNNRLVAVTSILECPTCTNFDNNIQIFTSAGNVLFSYQVGLQGISEVPYAVTLCPNGDDIIVVGEQTDAFGTKWSFATRIEMTNGAVIWSKTYDAFQPNATQQRFHGIKEITNAPLGSEEYFLYGSVQDPQIGGNLDKIHLVRIDGNGNYLYSTRIFEGNFNIHDGTFDPTDMKINRDGNYALVGTYSEVNAVGTVEKDIFLLEIDKWGQNVTQLQLYDVSNGTGVITWNQRPSIAADNSTGEYLLAFDSQDIIPGGPAGAESITGLLVLQGTNVPFGQPVVYTGTGYDNNQVSGADLHPINGGYLVGTIHSLPIGGGSTYPAGLLEIDPAMAVLTHTQYTPATAPLDYWCMFVGQGGVYHKAGHPNSDTYQVIYTDYAGTGGTNTCNLTQSPQSQQETAVHWKIKLRADNEPWVVDFNPAATPVGGSIDFCNGSQGTFKTIQGTEELALSSGLEVQLYPSIIDPEDLVKVEIIAKAQGKTVVDISNIAGQVLYHTEMEIETGTNLLEIPGAKFGPGLHFVRVRDLETGLMEVRKLVRR